MQADLVFSARDRTQLIKSHDAHLLEYFNVSLGVWFPYNFLHSKKRFSRHHPTAPRHGKAELWKCGGQSLIHLLNFPIAKERGVMTSGCGIERKQDHPSRFSIEAMNWDKQFQLAFFPQANKKRFMKKSPGRDHRQKMWFIDHQDMFVLIKNALIKGNSFFPLKLTVVKNTGSNTVRTS